MSSESKGIDCTNYDNCPKGDNVKVDPIKKDENSLNVVMVGCWGVYGWDKPIDIKEYSLEKFIEKGLGKERKEQYENFAQSIKKSDVIGELKEYPDIIALLTSLQKEYSDAKQDEKKDEIVNKLFKDTKEVYGQIKVIEGMQKLDIDALFLAGDNVYSYNKPKDELIKLIKSVLSGKNKIELLPTKKGYKKNPLYSPQQIKEQLSAGFSALVQRIPLKTNIFLGIGNHDIQTCEDLNEQFNHKHKNTYSRYGLHGLYYNVVYNMKDYNVNFIIIDTNMFSEDFHCDGKTQYTKDQRDKQITWVISSLQKNSCKFNIIIGHCPYIANPHKNETVKNRGVDGDVIGIRNDKLEVLFTRIKETQDIPKVQVYMCADEHNQQFLYDNYYQMGLVVAGSGGTALDYDLSREQKIKDVDSKFREASFGFVEFNFTDDEIAITYHNSKINEPAYFVKLNEKGEINYRK
jgi:hypothetical protein